MPSRRSSRSSSRRHATPRTWPIRFAIGFARIVVRLPLPMLLRLGALAGWLGNLLARDRGHIADVNLQLCFPERDAHARRALRRAAFRSTGIALVETALAWLGPLQALRPRCTLLGLEELELARASGRGVLLLGAHFSTLDIAGALLAQHIDLDVTYRYNRNPAIEALMRSGRARLYGGVIERDDIRLAVRRLRAGHVVWYAADQDFGRKHSVFAPFFGVPAATITAAARIARAGHAEVLFFSHTRLEQPWRWQLRIQRLDDAFPSDDPLRDATTLNRTIEREIRAAPEQYLWLHRRFKTRPDGEPRPY